jgi:hypothetical protein
MLVSDVFQVEMAVHTPLAHVSVGVVLLLLDPPHPAAASAASATRSAAPALSPVPAITLDPITGHAGAPGSPHAADTPADYPSGTATARAADSSCTM